MRVVAYVRVSTTEQTMGHGLELQEVAVKEYCNKHNLDLVHIYSDVESGTVKNRPGLLEAMEALQDCDGLIVYHTDRISRSLKYLLHFIDEICKKDKYIISTTQPEFDLNNPTGRLIMSILGAVGEFELSRITERMVSGRQIARQKAEGTNVNWGRRPRYGEKVHWEIMLDGSINKTLVPDEEALMVIDLIKRHRRSGKSYYKIANYLNNNEIPNKSGKMWNEVTVKALCTERSVNYK